ncbi:Uncharacterised protein [Mycobacteroides abscessus subsp. abscessus]|uniref:hypothetical protein n=1 Tax=Mycobacteroides abscessus TaxID=36809 RepID=UPI00092AAF6C|nr:hypothetical protein [Mycobacteroides abscessus]MBE5513787.1 hypothetical protein [Mycobacteroides abscessus]MBN7327667.1 hypothetical protein [Mycobacteroides abscessus subsp. abscessus]SID61492.1 Uncharacterised protein [Mycobacteroides abscessus subsp. abscessus]SIE84185.1 Uncharacterised protein [Mycobacteroides abscessus subsp. abscessus]SIF71904.1 Uncharacterised protein [Mycobacteroides abscessus subsp. abscessus]
MTELPMHLKRTPTPSNVAASAELSRAAAREAVRRIGRAAAALNALAQTEHPSTQQMVAACAAWHAAERDMHSAVVDVAAAAVLGGAAASSVARGAFGVRPQTLREWLRGTVADHRGADLEQQVDGDWKPIQSADLHVSAPEPRNGPDSSGWYTGNGGRDTSLDSAGAHGSSVGTGVDAVGAHAHRAEAPADASAPDRSTESGFDVEAAMDAAVGGA